MTDLRAGVIGAGVFGGYHAGKYAADARVAFAGVYDVDAARAGAVVKNSGGAAFGDLPTFLNACDIVTVAAPARQHGPLALAALEAGKHVLIEKPIAATPEEAADVVAVAAAHDRIVQVGHQERFVFRAMGLLDIGEAPRRIAARRLNPFSPRGSDVSVTLDLMTHDIDLARLLTGRAEAVSIAGATRRERTDHPDVSEGHIVFAGGTQADLRASRVHADRDRGMRLEYASGVVDVDFVAKTFRNTSAHVLNADFADDPAARDSLGAAVSAFIDAVLGDVEPAVSGADGLAAVTIAHVIDTAPAPSD